MIIDPNVDQTYCLREGEHYCVVNGKTFGPWPNHGAAAAGMLTEQRRAQKPPLCRNCGERHWPYQECEL